MFAKTLNNPSPLRDSALFLCFNIASTLVLNDSFARLDLMCSPVHFPLNLLQPIYPTGRYSSDGERVITCRLVCAIRVFEARSIKLVYQAIVGGRGGVVDCRPFPSRGTTIEYSQKALPCKSRVSRSPYNRFMSV